VQPTEDLYHRQRGAVFTQVSTSPLATSAGVGVYGFDDSGVDSKFNVSEDYSFMTFEHTDNVKEGCEAALSRPPGPAGHVCCGLGVILAVPPSSDHLVEQVCSYDREGDREEIGTDNLVVLCEVPRDFQPGLSGSFQDFTAPLGQGLGFYFAHHVNGLHEMANDMDCVKDDHCFSALLVDDIDGVLPHVATESIECGTAFFAPPLTEPAKGVLIAVSAAPYTPFPFQIIARGMVRRSPNSADLINADEPVYLVALPCSPLFKRSLSCCSESIRGEVEKPSHVIPRQQSRPESIYGDHSKADRSCTHDPGDTFHRSSMLRAGDPSSSAGDNVGDSPHRDMPPSLLFEYICGMTSVLTDTAGERLPLIGIQGTPQFMVDTGERHNTMVLDSESKPYDTFSEHESAPVSGVVGNTLSNG